GATEQILARREIILCAGAINSPQLLQCSGVGPGAVLRNSGVAITHELPGVGENLQDHLGASTTYRCNRKITLNDLVNDPIRRTLMGARYLLTRGGPMASNANYTCGFVRTDPAQAAPEIMLSLALWSRDQKVKAPGLDPYSGFTVLVTLLHPEARGSV